MTQPSKLCLHFGQRLEVAGSLSTLYFATILYFTRLPVAQVLALVLLTALAVALAYTIWLGPYELSGGNLGLKTSGSVRDIILGTAVALLGWWMYSEYLHLTRGYRLPIGLSQSSSLLIVVGVYGLLSLLNNSYQIEYALTVTFENRMCSIGPQPGVLKVVNP
jgi:hypothetical protein